MRVYEELNTQVLTVNSHTRNSSITTLLSPLFHNMLPSSSAHYNNLTHSIFVLIVILPIFSQPSLANYGMHTRDKVRGFLSLGFDSVILYTILSYIYLSIYTPTLHSILKLVFKYLISSFVLVNTPNNKVTYLFVRLYTHSHVYSLIHPHVLYLYKLYFCYNLGRSKWSHCLFLSFLAFCSYYSCYFLKSFDAL